jgi:hypothetical protein
MTTKEINIEPLPGEYWWGGRVADGRSMPYGNQTQPFRTELAISDNGNQASPLLISNKGRYVWSEEP